MLTKSNKIVQFELPNNDVDFIKNSASEYLLKAIHRNNFPFFFIYNQKHVVVTIIPKHIITGRFRD